MTSQRRNVFVRRQNALCGTCPDTCKDCIDVYGRWVADVRLRREALANPWSQQSATNPVESKDT